MYLLPSTWATLTDQLVTELTRSTGIAHVRRYEAAATLLADPTGRRQLAMSVGRFVMHPDVQSVAPALSLLQEMSDHPAGDLVLRLMHDGNPLLGRGAAGVAGPLLAQGAFPERGHPALERHVRLELRRPGYGLRRMDALDLASRLPQTSYARIVESIGDSRSRAWVARACVSHELVEADVSRATCESVASFAESVLGRSAHDPDQMLRRLLREALFHTHRDRRQLAAITLAASPHARPIAESLLRLTRDNDSVTSTMSWSLLRRLGHVMEREQVATLALDERSKALRPSALVVLGLSRGEVPSSMAEHLLRAATQSEDSRLGHAATFALGMAGHPLLETLANTPGPQMRSALWWSTVGPALYDDPAPAAAR